MKGKKKSRFDEEPVLVIDPGRPHLPQRAEGATEQFPVRTCIVQRARKERPFLLRFVASAQNEVIPDIKGCLPGRGVWVTAQKTIVSEAVRRCVFSRAFRRPVIAREDLPVQVEELFKQSALERFSICNKAGLLVLGFAKVEEAIRRHEIAGLIHASDGADVGRGKLDKKFLAVYSDKDHILPENCFTSAEMSLATGSANVIHAGLKEGGATRAFFEALDRLSGYRAGNVGVFPAPG